MSLYAAYGSNLDPSRMNNRCPQSPHAGTGWLEGWRLTFGESAITGRAVATIVEDPTERVFVSLYDLSPLDELELDAWERADSGMQARVRVRVHTLEGSRLAWAYVLDSYEGGLPSARTLAALAEAAEVAGAPDDYVIGLRSRPCRASDR